MKQYMLQEFQNPENIIALRRDVKTSMMILNKSWPTALSTDDKKDPIMLMIQTEEINQYVKIICNVIEHYKTVWTDMGKFLPRPTKLNRKVTRTTSHMHRDMTSCGYSKNKMCTSRIDHTSNGYYSTVMYTRNIFFLRQWKYEATEAYYRWFDEFIFTDELEKCTATMYTELNRS